jgi:2'-5' RNA ligase
LRLFVAINLPADVRRGIFSAAAHMRAGEVRLGWTPEDSLHVTLKFLGEVPEQRLPEITAAVERAAHGASAFEMDLRTLGGFPNLARATVLWLGVESEPPLLALQESVERELAPLGFPPEKRAYHPHVTLGRSQQPLRGDVLKPLIEAFNYSGCVEVGSIDLMRSRTNPGGARYERIAAVPLPGA